MRFNIAYWSLVLLFFAIGMHSPLYADVLLSGRALPDEVVRFISRVENCQHWADEEAYDTARAAEIDDGLKKGGCGQLEQEEQRLRQKYARSPAIQRAIKEATRD